ncbi:MAG: hypothetical protein M1819_006822 [Sarea resinae]|nr:MAG: hypothetical protein M1819_006822 [Sarea resinae]
MFHVRRACEKVLNTPKYLLATVVISIGGFLNGYDTGSIGSITTMPYFSKDIEVLSPTMRGFTVSLIMLAGAVPSLFAGHVADRYGHLHVVLAGAILFAVGAALEAGSVNLAMLLVGRILCGGGEGLYLGNLNVYICEIAPMKRRGVLVAVPQLLVTLGICTGYFTCYGSTRIPSSLSWRLPFIIQAAGGTVMAMTCVFLPNSPRWLMLHGRRDEAIFNIERLNLSAAEAEKDILQAGEESFRGNPRQTSLIQGYLISFQKRYRSRTFLALFILGMVQLCGIDGILYYAPTLFAQAGLSVSSASFVASGVSGILMLAITIPAFLLVDHWGRRTCVIVGGTSLTACMFIIGSLYASNSVHGHKGAGRWVVIVFIFVFALTYCSTWGIVGKIYASEIQPAQTRAAANSLAQGLNFFTNWIVAFATPIFLAHSSYGPYFLFGSLSLITVVVLVMFMPETQGRSLESIQGAFHKPAMIGSLASISKLFSKGRGGNDFPSELAYASEIEML